MSGVNRETGKPLSAAGHIAQSISDILTTPLGSRVMRRDYGSLVPDLVDAPCNAQSRILIYAAIATALMRWEPRIRLNQVQLDAIGMDGTAHLVVDATFVDTNEAQRLSVPLKLGALA